MHVAYASRISSLNIIMANGKYINDLHSNGWHVCGLESNGSICQSHLLVKYSYGKYSSGLHSNAGMAVAKRVMAAYASRIPHW